jgi:hypothetical protein
MDAASGERVDRAIWRNAREIVVLTGGDAPGAMRLEVWSLDGRRRVVLLGARDLSGIRADGTAAIVDREAIDLDTGVRSPIPGVTGPSRIVATLLLR